MSVANSVIERTVLGILAKREGLSASQIVSVAQEASVNVTKTLVNSALYKLQLRGAVELTSLSGGKKPRWSLATNKQASDPLGDRLYRLVIANPGKRVHVAELAANLLEEFDHPKAGVVRKIAEALRKK